MTELSLQPFATAERAQLEQYVTSTLLGSEAAASAIASGTWESCDTCADPGPDPQPPPGPDAVRDLDLG